MRNYFLISLSLIVGLLLLTLFYLSYYGIKTNKFNNLINDQIKDFNQNLSLETKDVFLKLKLKEKSIKINTNNPKIFSGKNFIELSKIEINLDLIKFFKNENSIKNVEIDIKENSIKNLTNFINAYKFNLQQFIILNLIERGKAQIRINIYFDQENKSNYRFSVTGEIKEARLNIINKAVINNINFNFNIKDQNLVFENINFKYDNIEFESKKTIVKKLKNIFKVKGDLNSKKTIVNPNSISKLFNLDFDLINQDKILLETNNNFSFNIDAKRQVKDLNYKSNIIFDKIIINKKYQDLIFLSDGKIETEYSDKNLDIKIVSDYLFLNDEYNIREDEKNIIINIKKNNKDNLKVESLLKNKKTKINSKELTKYFKIDKKFFKDQTIIFGSDNKITFNIDKNTKVKNLKIKSNINFENLKIDYISNNLKKRIPNYKGHIFLNSEYLELDYKNNKTQIKAKGRYSFNNKFDDYEINIINEKNKYDFESSINVINNPIIIEEIDYKKNKDSSSTIKLKGNYIKNKNIKIEHLLYSEDKNRIAISNLKLSKNYKIKDIDTLELNYLNKNKNLNYLKILKNKNKYVLKSENFDGESLVKNLLDGNSNNSFLKFFKNLNSEIILNLEKLYIGNQSNLKNIEGNIIVKNNIIKYGKIYSLLNENNKFSLNIKTNSDNEKTTNLYIERPEPFIKNYKFIKGFDEGNLSYDSIEKNGLSKSTLKIYDFKVKEVPVLAKILSLASLHFQGYADLLTGEGIRFDEFEMNYESINNLTTINEIYAIGPAISMLMEGYIEKNKLTSLRGTLVPATSLNKIIAKIPKIGELLVGKKIGEGVFGVSFKIKGPPKDLKTTVNPVKTLTPRFITRTLEKLKKN